ncbi:hypothetical protein RRF57_008817 [Xylaria bambusicola]|uniref:Uncharacterized protein n=1 Tax=Xylaria bambusicola TaxID=326684 RepID=A0AAN7UNP0_9PEZI
MASSQQNIAESLAPFRPGDMFDLPMPGVAYFPNHPLTQQLNQDCTEDAVERFKDIWPNGVAQRILHHLRRRQHIPWLLSSHASTMLSRRSGYAI